MSPSGLHTSRSDEEALRPSGGNSASLKAMILIFHGMDPLVNRLAFYGFMLQAALDKKKKKKLQSAAASEVSLEVTVFAQKGWRCPLQLNRATLFYFNLL